MERDACGAYRGSRCERSGGRTQASRRLVDRGVPESESSVGVQVGAFAHVRGRENALIGHRHDTVDLHTLTRNLEGVNKSFGLPPDVACEPSAEPGPLIVRRLVA